MLGISFFLHQTVVFDTSQSKRGIAESKCPESHYQTRSGRPAQARAAALRVVSTLETSLSELVWLVGVKDMERGGTGR